LPRLLQCTTCSTLEKLPDYNGPKNSSGVPPEGYDVLLDNLVALHKFPNGDPHIGNLYNVDEKLWDKMDTRTQIEKEIWKDTAEFSATKSFYEDEAMKCFNQHHRPKQGCIDYMDDSKRLGNPTKEGWKAGIVDVRLCSFCPVHSWVTTQIRTKKGMYD